MKRNKNFFVDENGITRARKARIALDRQNKKVKTITSQRSTLIETQESRKNVEEAIERSRKENQELRSFLQTTKIKREKIGKKYYWTVRNPNTKKIVDKTPAKGKNKLQAWQSFNKQAKRFDNGNIVFAQTIGMAKERKAKGLLVKQYVTRNPDKRFGNRGQAQFKASATVVFTKEFMKKYKAPRQITVKGIEGYSNASGKLSQNQKKVQAKQRWKAGVFLAVKKKLGLDPSTNLSYELVEIVPTNQREQTTYYVYENE